MCNIDWWCVLLWVAILSFADYAHPFSFQSSHVYMYFFHIANSEQALHLLNPYIDPMAAKQEAYQIVEKELQSLDRSSMEMELNLRIGGVLVMPFNLVQRVHQYQNAAINSLNVALAQQRLNQPSSSSLSFSSLVALALANPSVHMNNNLGGMGFLGQQQQQISSGYGLVSNQVVQVQESNQVLMGATTATMQQRMPTNHRSKHPSDLLDSSTSEEETSASDDTPGDKDTSSNSDHQTSAVDSLHGLNCLAVASMISQGQ